MKRRQLLGVLGIVGIAAVGFLVVNWLMPEHTAMERVYASIPRGMTYEQAMEVLPSSGTGSWASTAIDRIAYEHHGGRKRVDSGARMKEIVHGIRNMGVSWLSQPSSQAGEKRVVLETEFDVICLVFDESRLCEKMHVKGRTPPSLFSCVSAWLLMHLGF